MTNDIYSFQDMLWKREALHPVVGDGEGYTFEKLGSSGIAEKFQTPMFDPAGNFINQAQLMLNVEFAGSDRDP